MDKKTVKKKTSTKKKTWGEEGYEGVVNYGCYTYAIKFTPQEEISKIVQTSSGRVYGAICYDEQIIVVASDITEQLKRLTVWHEVFHMLLQNNNVDSGKVKFRIDDEGFVDTMASRVYEFTIRNPELMGWLQK